MTDDVAATDVRSTPIDAAAKANLAAHGLRFELLTSDDDAFEPWYQAVLRGFHAPRAESEHLPTYREGMAHRRLCGIWDDTTADPATPIATASSWVAELTVPGRRSIPSWPISTITVAATHRRRGIARNLIEAELRTAAALGVPLAILTASEATIYERFGFAPAAMRADWTIDTTRAKWAGPIPSGRVQLVTTEQGRDEGGQDILDRARLQTPGQMFFDGHLWKRLFGLPGRGNPNELRVVRYDDADGAQQGLAIYRVEESDDHAATVHIDYLTTATDDAYAGLWRYLLELDLVSTVKATLRSVDEPVRWQISDARAASEDRVGDHLWTRILDVKAALEARTYSAPGVFVLEIDDGLGFANGTYRLEIDATGTGTVEPVTAATRDDGIPGGGVLRHAAPGDAAPGEGALRDGVRLGDGLRLRMSVSELSAIYLGGVSAVTLARAGRITEGTPAAASAVDAAFRSDVSPWLSIWF